MDGASDQTDNATEASKMSMMSNYTVSFPCWGLNYLFNGETEGLTDEEIRMVDQWVKENPGTYSLSDDGWHFMWTPEFGLACDCEDLTVSS